MENLAIRCDRCGSPVPEGEIDRSLSLAHCPGCDHVFQWAPALVGSAQVLPAPPAGVSVVEEGGQLAVTWRWYSWHYLFLGVFAALWNGFLMVFLMASGGDAPGFVALHVIAGILVAYTAGAGLVNASTFRFDDGRLTVKHGPLPWPNAVDMPLSEVQQVCCRRIVKRNKNGGETVSYDLEVVNGPRVVKVLAGLRDIAVAHWIERRIEAHLRIADQPIAGEAPKG